MSKNDLKDDAMNEHEIDETDLEGDETLDEDEGSTSPESEVKDKKKDILKKYGAFMVAGVVAAGFLGLKALGGNSNSAPPVTMNPPNTGMKPENQPPAQPLPATEVKVTPGLIDGNNPNAMMANAAQGGPSSPMEMEPRKESMPDIKRPQGLDGGTPPAAANMNVDNKDVTEIKQMIEQLKQNGGSVGVRLDQIENRLAALEGRLEKGVKANSEVQPMKHNGSRMDSSDGGKMQKAKKKKATNIKATDSDELFESKIEVQKELTVQKAPEPVMKLRGVIKGRFWVSTASGDESFSADSVLPNGSRVIKIDPERGEVTTTKGVLKMPLE